MTPPRWSSPARGMKRPISRTSPIVPGVSKGSLYDYFDNKEDLYLAVCTHGIAMSRREHRLHHRRKKGLLYPDSGHLHPGARPSSSKPPVRPALRQHLVQRHGAIRRSASRLPSKSIPPTTIRRPSRGIDEGFIRPDLDVDMAAFLINSMYVIMMISIVSRHYRIRLREYLNLPTIRSSGASERRSISW